MSPVLAPAGIIGTFAGGLLHDASSIGLSAVSGWVVAGSEAMLAEVVKAIGLVSTPSFTASWFSGTYWRISALALLLTLPFLFAAAVQAIVRTDLGVLIRAALVDLPIAAIGVSLAAPLITLLLAATDEMCSLVTGGQSAGASFLRATAADLAGAHGGFLLMIIAVVILVAGMLLMIELIIRSAAIYVVVLFLPLGFAAMVWPARRVWIKRMTELLVALILSKFAMVAILTLAVTGLASITTGGSSVTTALTAMTLLLLACASPLALLRLLPFAEVAAGAHASLRHDTRQGISDAAGIAKQIRGHTGELTAGLADPVADRVRAMSDDRADPSRGPGQPGQAPASAGGLSADAAPIGEAPAASAAGPPLGVASGPPGPTGLDDQTVTEAGEAGPSPSALDLGSMGFALPERDGGLVLDDLDFDLEHGERPRSDEPGSEPS